MTLRKLNKRTAVQRLYDICIFTVADVYRCCYCRCFMRMQVSMFLLVYELNTRKLRQ
jgi:hypothetical protein